MNYNSGSTRWINFDQKHLGKNKPSALRLTIYAVCNRIGYALAVIVMVACFLSPILSTVVAWQQGAP